MYVYTYTVYTNPVYTHTHTVEGEKASVINLALSFQKRGRKSKRDLFWKLKASTYF